MNFPEHQRGLVSLKLIQFGGFRLVFVFGFAITSPEVTQASDTQTARLIGALVRTGLAPDSKASRSDSEETKSATLHAPRRALLSHILLDFMTLVVKMQPLNIHVRGFSPVKQLPRLSAVPPSSPSARFGQRETL